MTHIYVECNCDTDGSSSQVCDSTSGKCSCKSELIVGDKCDKCKPGYFGFPDCKGKVITNVFGLLNKLYFFSL